MSLTSKGYAILKSSLTPQQTKLIQQTLTVSPKSNSKFATAGQPFAVYFESATKFYLPRHWAREQFGKETADLMSEGVTLPSSISFKGKPFDYQEKIIDSFFAADGNGLICVPCGKGKTFMALSIAARIGKRFLVIVDKEFLLNQWKGEMEAFFPGLKIGILQQDRKEIGIIKKPPPPQLTIPEIKEKLRVYKLKLTGTRDELLKRLREVEPEPIQDTIEETYDCCIAMIQTLVQNEFAADEFKGFGFTIFDECHHLGASNFSQALLKVQTKKMLGLSATPERDDGLTKVFMWYLGEPVYWEKTREKDTTVQVRIVQFKTKDREYIDEPVDYRGEVVMARLLGQVVSCVPRLKAVVNEILDLAKEDGRRILVLSERKGHLEALEQLIGPSGHSMSYYIGGMKEEVRESGAKTAKILLATYAMASEAMNIRSLNTVILASPRKKIEQSVGRILRERPSERKVLPIIVDVVDMHGLYQGQFKKRRVFYRKCGYGFQTRIYNEASLEMDKTSESEEEDEKIDLDQCAIVD
jgi:superfamily II DNA or RNA helicase